jgi:phosphoketolase
MSDTPFTFSHPMLLHARRASTNRQGNEKMVYRFRNGYGASMIWDKLHSEPVYEIAVTRYSGPEDGSWELCYETHITDDVLRHMDADIARSVLEQVGDLPPDALALAGAKLD